MENQRVVVIQDASRDLNTSAVKWAIDGLLLKPGDKLVLLGVLDRVDTPMGFKSKVDSGSMFGANEKFIKEAVARKAQEYQANEEIMDIGTICESRKIDFKIEVVAGHSRKETALDVASNWKATRVVLDRTMKKDSKYFLQKLSCGVSRIKNGNKVEELRAPKPSGTSKSRDVSFRNCSINEEKATVQTVDRKPFPAGLQSLEIPGRAEAIEEDFVQTRGVEIEVGSDSGFENGNYNWPTQGRLRDFTYEELHDSTDGFSQENCLFSGEFESAFKGQLKDGMEVVIKKSKNVFLEKEEFESKVYELSRARHRNVIVLLGSCGEGNNRILVYPYACNGSLDQHVSEHSRRPLTWTERISIAFGASRGFQYLHENRIIHRDIRLNNILLTRDLEPLIGELGIKYKEDSKRCFEYQAPEYTKSSVVSSKTDVYSFGVVLLELITGRVAMEMAMKETSLLRWARPLLCDEKYMELVDPRLGKSYDVQQFLRMVQVARNCLAKNPKRRVTMDWVVWALEFISRRNTAEATATHSNAKAPEMSVI